MVGGSVLGLAASAQAHNYVVASTQAQVVVTTLPSEFSVTTNAPLLTLGGSTDGFALQVVDSAGQYYGDGCIQVTGATISSGATLANRATTRWVQVVSEDGHPVSGEIAFSWQPVDATRSRRDRQPLRTAAARSRCRPSRRTRRSPRPGRQPCPSPLQDARTRT